MKHGFILSCYIGYIVLSYLNRNTSVSESMNGVGECVSPEQVNSCFCISATLSPLSGDGAVHWVNRPIVGLCLNHSANQDR